MLIMIILKMLKIYNKDKKFINKENKKMYKELCHTNNFKNNFDLIFFYNKILYSNFSKEKLLI